MSSLPAVPVPADIVGAGDVLNNSLLLSLFIGLLVGLPGYMFAYDFIDFFAANPDVAKAGTGYMQWRFIGIGFFLFVVSYRGFFNGIGHTKVFLYSAIIINLSNIFFNYVLIFGGFGIPAMGLTGAGLAVALSQCGRLAVLHRCNFFAGISKNLQVLLEVPAPGRCPEPDRHVSRSRCRSRIS